MKIGQHELRWLDAPWLDVVLALALAAEMELETWLVPGLTPTHRLVTTVAVVLYAGPIAGRGRWPLAALLASASVAMVQAPLGGNILGGMTGSLLPPIALAYRAGTARSLSRGLPTVAGAAALLILGVYVSDQVTQPNDYGSLGGDIAGFAAAVVVPWGVGLMVAERAARASAFRDLSARLVRQREEHQSAAVEQERTRIGREMQDIIAQSVSAIVVQAGGTRHFILHEADRAWDSIHAIEQLGREALADLRRALTLLHPVDTFMTPMPPPGLSQLRGLAAAMNANGLTCTLDTDGNRVPIPVGVDLVAYRLVETALRIAAEEGASRASITLENTCVRVALKITSNVAVDDLAEQLGEVRERMTLYHGVIQTSPRTDTGGFSIEAQLPLRGFAS